MAVYEYYKEQNKKNIKGKIVLAVIAVVAIVFAVIASNIYLEIIQLNEIGNFSSVYLTGLFYKAIFFFGSFIFIFLSLSVTNIFLKRNIKKYAEENGLQPKKLPNFSLSALIALIGAFLSRDFFYQKALNFFNSTPFGKTDPIFSKDIGYYVFQRPFLMSIYEFVSTAWLFVIIFTLVYYIAAFISLLNDTFNLSELKSKTILRHNLINIAIFFGIKAFSYKFQKEGILYSKVVNVTGASYIDEHIWLNYYNIAPVLLILIVVISFFFISKGKLRRSAYTIAVYPVVWILVSLIAFTAQTVVVKPNEINLESKYLKYNMEETREAYKINTIKNSDFSSVKDLTPDIINKNPGTKDNIRVVDYQATLNSDVQLQSIKNFYTFHNGDIINYNINGKDTPVFIAAREIDKNKLPEQSDVNTIFKYTHGYGVVVNPINRLNATGQVNFIMSGLKMDSVDSKVKVSEPRIYYGELTYDHVIVNAANGLDEIDYDGNSSTRYSGAGGIKLGLMNRLLFATKYGDFNMLVSGYVSNDSKLLLNRDIIHRAQMAMPFLSIDNDPYMIITADGRLKWVIDAYTTTDYYPYSQDYGGFNYIRNSVKIVIDAYDGKVNSYVIDNSDPIINTYRRIYPNAFTNGPLPQDISQHMRYPEFLFKVQTDLLRRYHLDPKADAQNVAMFYSQQDLWDIAKYPQGTDTTGNKNADTAEVGDIEPYYNMIKLPGGIGQKEELILMRPFTPSNKNNMVSWLAVRNSSENYGEMILFNFPKNTNILGPNQIEVKINQIDKVSKDMSLWNQSGSRVFKGSLLVIPVENSVLYVEPIYIQATSQSSIPEVREIIVGYQKENSEEFRYGIGATLDDALNDLFAGQIVTTEQMVKPAEAAGKATDEKLLNDIITKYDSLKKQLEELGSLINELKK